MRRRRFLQATGSGAALGLAGCLVQDEGSDTSTDTTASEATTGTGATGTTSEDTTTAEADLEGTITVATYDSFLDAPSESYDAPGAFVKERFEAEYPEATVEYTVPENGLNEYIQRRQQGASVDADLYVGLNVDDLVRIDENLDDGQRLFRELDTNRMAHANRVRDDLDFGDPEGRALAYDTGYISLVFDENDVDAPATLDELTQSEYEGTLLAQNAQGTDTGQAFLLWTIAQKGADGYLDYWEQLLDNDVRILGSWWDSYSAYLDEQRPMVVSYSNDQVFANRDDQDMSRHRIGFPNDQGYANPEGMGVVQSTEETTLSYAFMDVMLRGDVQQTLALSNVQFPAVKDEHVDVPAEFSEYAKRPPNPVSLGYDELSGNLSGWLDEWSRLVASN